MSWFGGAANDAYSMYLIIISLKNEKMGHCTFYSFREVASFLAMTRVEYGYARHLGVLFKELVRSKLFTHHDSSSIFLLK